MLKKFGRWVKSLWSGESETEKLDKYLERLKPVPPEPASYIPEKERAALSHPELPSVSASPEMISDSDRKSSATKKAVKPRKPKSINGRSHHSGR